VGQAAFLTCATSFVGRALASRLKCGAGAQVGSQPARPQLLARTAQIVAEPQITMPSAITQ